jgi:uncharacterized coiled-coil DUF342 family protein
MDYNVLRCFEMNYNTANRIYELKKHISECNAKIDELIQDVDWQKLALYDKFLAIKRYKQQNGGSLLVAKERVEQYIEMKNQTEWSSPGFRL